MKRSVLAMAVLACFPIAYSQLAGAQSTPKAPEPAEAPQAIESIVVQGSFLGAGSQSAMKLDVPVRDTPFSVSSYTESFMKAIETTNVADMYNYMTGVKRAGNTGYDLTIRGFKTSGNDRNAILVDGLPGLSGRFGSPPTVGVDHIELVKGPMSVLYGQAQPGGFINLISKKPKGQRALELDVKGTAYQGAGLKLGDSPGWDLAVDATGPIDANRAFLYRIVAQGADRDLYRTNAYEKPLFIAPSLTWNISDNTFVTAQFEYRTIEFGYDTFLVAPARDVARIAPIVTRYQEPGDTEKEDGKTLSIALDHTFANDIRWNTAARFVRHTDDAKGFDAVAVRANLTSLQRRARGQHNERAYDFADSNLTIPLDTGFLKHRILVGVNGGKEIADLDRLQFFNGGACPGAQCLDIDIYNPVYGVVPSLDSLPRVNPNTPANLNHRYTTSKSFGVYFSDLVTISEQWKATFGARRAHETQKIEERKLANVPDQTKTSDKTLPLVGLLFQPTKEITLYTSYSTSYVAAPATAQDVNGQNPFKPENAKQIEAGVKVERLLGGKLNATLGAFKIDKKDVLNTFTCTLGTCSEQIGGEQSKGLELEVNTRLRENWQVTLGYAYTDAKVTDSRDPAQVGARLTNSAKNSGSVWSRYDVREGFLKGLGIGVGAVYTGERTGFLPTTADGRLMLLPSYTVVDFGLSYIYDRYAFNFKVGNVFDRKFYESAGFTADIQIVPGTPRNFALSMRVHF